MPKSLVYAIESLKFESSVIFYGIILLVILLLSSSVRFATGGTATHVFSAVPYTVPHAYSPTLAAAQVASWQAAHPAADTATVWPLHGKVTTEFGDPDFPFQSSHTGIDISSGQPSGNIGVVAFRGGTVLSVIRSNSSYGNHVIIDHGNGLTSLYGHLYSISVSVGQYVNAGDTIGTEGSSGDSTGTHLHFEIREQNIPHNPRRYVMGSP